MKFSTTKYTEVDVDVDIDMSDIEEFIDEMDEKQKDHIIKYIMGGSGTYSLQDVEKKELLELAYNKFSLKDLENKLGTKFDLM